MMKSLYLTNLGFMICLGKPFLPPPETSPPANSEYNLLPYSFLLGFGCFAAVIFIAVTVAARTTTSTSSPLSDSEFEDVTIADTNSASEHDDNPVRVLNGKPVRGKDFSWITLEEFDDASSFHASNLHKKIIKEFTATRKRQFEYAEVTEYRCKFARKKRFLPCPWKVRVLLLSHCQAVRVESTEHCQEHVHEVDNKTGLASASGNYIWTPQMNEFVVQCVQNHAKPKVALRNMEDAGCFEGYIRPSMVQLYNKIHAVKKEMNKNPAMADTFQMRELVTEHIDEPEDPHEAFIPYYEIHDGDSENLRFSIIFSSTNCLARLHTYIQYFKGCLFTVCSRLKSDNVICCDATYRLNWLNYPVFVVGVASPTGKIRISLVVLSSHEDYLAQMTILKFVKSLGVVPKFLMGE